MVILNEEDLKAVQSRIIDLQLVLQDAKKNVKSRQEYEKLYQSFSLGLKKLEDEVYQYLSNYQQENVSS